MPTTEVDSVFFIAPALDPIRTLSLVECNQVKRSFSQIRYLFSKMTEATTTVTTIATPTGISIPSIDDVFAFAHQLFDQHRTTILVLTGTCTFNFF